MSFSITTLRGFMGKINQGSGGGGGPEAPLFSFSVGCYGLYGTISTVTEGATIRWTNDGSDPTCSTGNEIPCSTATIVQTNETPGSCEDIIEITSSPSSTTVKAIACLAGVASPITSTTISYTCPESVSAPSLAYSCPNGDNGSSCNFGPSGDGVDYTITPPNDCGTTYIRYGFNADPDLTVSDTNFDYTAIGSPLTINVYDPLIIEPIVSTWVTAVHIHNTFGCSVTSSVVQITKDYLNPSEP